MVSTTAFDYSTDYILAALILLPARRIYIKMEDIPLLKAALFGFLCNLIVVIFLRVIPSLNNSFGILTLSQAASDCVHQAIFTFYLAPCILFRSAELYSWSEQVAFVLLITYEICGMSHLCISINRSVAVFMPLTYSNVFSTRNTRVLIVIYWIFGIISVVIMLKILDCSQFLPFGLWIFAYKDTPTCHIVMWYPAYMKYTIFVGIVAILDVASCVRMLTMRHSGLQDADSAKRRRSQMNLVFQAALQGFLFMTELITYFVLSPYAQNKWAAYLLTTVSWCLVHGLDGFIVLAYNRDFRRQIKNTILCKTKLTLKIAPAMSTSRET